MSRWLRRSRCAWAAEARAYRRLLLVLIDHLDEGDTADLVADYLYPGSDTDRDAILAELRRRVSSEVGS